MSTNSQELSDAYERAQAIRQAQEQQEQGTSVQPDHQQPANENQPTSAAKQYDQQAMQGSSLGQTENVKPEFDRSTQNQQEPANENQTTSAAKHYDQQAMQGTTLGQTENVKPEFDRSAQDTDKLEPERSGEQKDAAARQAALEMANSINATKEQQQGPEQQPANENQPPSAAKQYDQEAMQTSPLGNTENVKPEFDRSAQDFQAQDQEGQGSRMVENQSNDHDMHPPKQMREQPDTDKFDTEWKDEQKDAAARQAAIDMANSINATKEQQQQQQGPQHQPGGPER